MSTTTTQATAAAARNAELFRMGIADMRAAIAAKTFSEAECFAEVERRVTKAKHPSPHVVTFRNVLASTLGVKPVPVPEVRAKGAAFKPDLSGSAAELAEDIASAGVDIPALITALAARMQQGKA